MKIRHLDSLVDSLDAELAWRRRELSALRGEINARQGLTRAMLLRAGQALLYAHWEGFVKAGCDLYVTFVATKKLKLEELSTPFVAMCLRRTLNEAIEAGTLEPGIALVHFLRTSMSERSNVPTSNAIRTKSNLTSFVLQRILRSVGMDSHRYELKHNLIDERLVDPRNAVAHGKDLEVGADDLNELMDDVIGMMTDIRDELVRHASEDLYRAV